MTKVMQIGFTGTQIGMTDDQFDALDRLLESMGEGVLHHGDCVGADAQAHYLAKMMGYTVVIHPPVNQIKRALRSELNGNK